MARGARRPPGWRGGVRLAGRRWAGARAAGSPATRVGRVAAAGNAAAQLWGSQAGGARGRGCAPGGARVPAAGSWVAGCCGIRERRVGDTASQACAIAFPRLQERGVHSALPRSLPASGERGRQAAAGPSPTPDRPGHRASVSPGRGVAVVHCPGSGRP